MYYESLPNPSDVSNPDKNLTKKDLERRRYEYTNSYHKMPPVDEKNMKLNDAKPKPKPKKTLKTSDAVKLLSNLLISERSRQNGCEIPENKVLFMYYCLLLLLLLLHLKK